MKPRNQFERQVITYALSLGLMVRFESNPVQMLAHLLDRHTGRLLLTYLPDSQRIFGKFDRVTWEEALNEAARERGISIRQDAEMVGS